MWHRTKWLPLARLIRIPADCWVLLWPFLRYLLFQDYLFLLLYLCVTFVAIAVVFTNYRDACQWGCRECGTFLPTVEWDERECVHSISLVRDDSATYFFELLFVTRFLTDFIKGLATEQSAIDKVCSLHVIGSRPQRHLFFRLLFVTRFLTDFVKGFAIEKSSIERVCSLYVIGSRRQRHLFFQIIIC